MHKTQLLLLRSSKHLLSQKYSNTVEILQKPNFLNTNSKKKKSLFNSVFTLFCMVQYNWRYLTPQKCYVKLSPIYSNNSRWNQENTCSFSTAVRIWETGLHYAFIFHCSFHFFYYKLNCQAIS